jgi:hypothetical protein
VTSMPGGHHVVRVLRSQFVTYPFILYDKHGLRKMTISSRKDKRPLKRTVRKVRSTKAHLSPGDVQKVVDDAVREVRAERREQRRRHVMRAYRSSLAKYASLYEKLAGPSPNRRRRTPAKSTRPKSRKLRKPHPRNHR